VAGLTRGVDVAFQIRLALANRGDSLLGDHFETLGVEDACGLEVRRGDRVSRVVVTIRAGTLGRVILVGEAGVAGLIDVLMALQATLVRDGGVLLHGERGLSRDVYPYLAQRHDLVAELLGHLGVDMAVDAWHLGVRALTPCRVVRSHLVAAVAEHRLTGGFGRAQESKKRDTERSKEQSDGQCGMGQCPRTDFSRHGALFRRGHAGSPGNVPTPSSSASRITEF